MLIFWGALSATAHRSRHSSLAHKSQSLTKCDVWRAGLGMWACLGPNQHLGAGDALALAAGDAPHDGVPDQGVGRAGQAQRAQQDLQPDLRAPHLSHMHWAHSEAGSGCIAAMKPSICIGD